MATTTKKATANRANSRRSTGPKTNAGRAVAKMNATAHGLRSAAPVIPGERAEDFDAFRAGVVATLAPVGTLEAELADRVASLSWRLRRVVAYETGAAADAIADGVRAARGDDDADDDDMLALIGLPGADDGPTRPSRRQLDEARKSAKCPTSDCATPSAGCPACRPTPRSPATGA